MAPSTSARNASPAPRAGKKGEDSKENDSQNLIQDEHEQLSKKLQTTLKNNVNQDLRKNENVQEPQKQGKLATLKNNARATVQSTGRRLALACFSCRARACGILKRSKVSLVEGACGISQRRKVSLVAFLTVLIACIAFVTVYSTSFAGEFTAGVQKFSVYSTGVAGEFAAGVQKISSRAWSATSQAIAGLASPHSEASVDL